MFQAFFLCPGALLGAHSHQRNLFCLPDKRGSLAFDRSARYNHHNKSVFACGGKDMIHLEKIDSTNIWEIVDLKVFQSQKNFVAANWVSIVQAYGVRDSATVAFPFAIYNDKRPVGFLMIGFNEAAQYENWDDIEAPKSLVNNYSLWRLMIDKRYQKRGYGKEAIKQALDFIRTWPCGKAEYCSLSYEPENEVARELYRSLGFVENGEMDGDEIVAVLKL